MEVNLDTTTAITFFSEGSPERHRLKAFVQGRSLIMAQAAVQEFQAIILAVAGPTEQARAHRFLNRIATVPDNPSPRASRLRSTNALEPNDPRAARHLRNDHVRLSERDSG